MKLCKGFINIVHLLMHEEKLITTVPYNYSIYDSQNPFARLGIKIKKTNFKRHDESLGH